jgi:hypothetical protein
MADKVVKMEIQVIESTNGYEIQDIINESEFIRLYGVWDFTRLKQNGEVGDVIGQRKWYKAKVIKN